MDSHKFQQAAQYAINLLQQKILPAFTYHNLDHTLDVVDACAQLAELEGIDEESSQLLLIAAYYHDTGWTAISQMDSDTYNAARAMHEKRAVQIAREILPSYGFTSEEIETIARLILATKLGHTPEDILEQVIADADMSPIGQVPSSFLRSNTALRRELTAFGMTVKDTEWYENQKEFLDACSYHTVSARDLFDKNRLLNSVVVNGIQQ